MKNNQPSNPPKKPMTDPDFDPKDDIIPHGGYKKGGKVKKKSVKAHGHKTKLRLDRKLPKEPAHGGYKNGGKAK